MKKEETNTISVVSIIEKQGTLIDIIIKMLMISLKTFLKVQGSKQLRIKSFLMLLIEKKVTTEEEKKPLNLCSMIKIFGLQV